MQPKIVTDALKGVNTKTTFADVDNATSAYSIKRYEWFPSVQNGVLSFLKFALALEFRVT